MSSPQEPKKPAGRGGSPRRAGSSRYTSRTSQMPGAGDPRAPSYASRFGRMPGSDSTPYSPVAQALEDARRRALSNGAWMGQFIGNAAAGPGNTQARRASASARHTPDGRRISGKQSAENIFEKQYNDQMRGAAETVFGALNMDGIVGTMSYNVGVEMRREQVHGSADSIERRINEGVEPVRAREVMVQNTITGGIADFQRMSAQQPDVYNTMVYRLWQAGLIDGKIQDAGLGGWTPKAGKALGTAMSSVAQLNEQGIPTTLDEYVDSLISGREKAEAEFGDGSGGGQGPAPRSYTSRDELNSRLKSTAQEVLGRALSDEEAEKFAAAFRGKEDTAYDAAEADRDYENPNATASAETFVEDGYETEAAAFRMQGFMERLKTEMGL